MPHFFTMFITLAFSKGLRHKFSKFWSAHLTPTFIPFGGASVDKEITFFRTTSIKSPKKWNLVKLCESRIDWLTEFWKWYSYLCRIVFSDSCKRTVLNQLWRKQIQLCATIDCFLSWKGAWEAKGLSSIPKFNLLSKSSSILSLCMHLKEQFFRSERKAG